MTSSSRRQLLLLFSGLATAATLPAAALARAQGARQDAAAFNPADLIWDEARARTLWRRAAPPFVVIDDYSMRQLGETYSAPWMSLSAEQKAEVVATLQAAATFYKSRGLGPPELPIANDAFHVFFVTGMGDVNGSSGPASGTSRAEAVSEDLAAIADWAFGSVPEGSHMLINADNYFSPSDKHLWAPPTTLAHELLHTVDRYIVGGAWRDDIGKWWTEGNVEAVAPFALAGLGYRPMSLWRAGERDHAQNVGMRPYDYPLTLKGVPERLPPWVKNGAERGSVSWLASLFEDAPTEAQRAQLFFANNATYFTSSFWRFLLQEEAPHRPPLQPGAVPMPGNFELMSALRRIRPTDADRAAVSGNPHLDAGIPALDRFLRGSHPTWGATGLHRAFPAFIAHWIEWPDQVVKSRNGLFYHPSWIDTVFMDGARYHELTPDQDITVDLTVLPLAAKAIRFETPPVFSVVGDEYAPVTISVSVLDGNGQSRPIDNIHVGLRGQCLGNGHSQPGRHGRVRRWASIKATPLNRSKVSNETVLSFINVAPDPSTTRPVRIRVTVSLQVASSTGQPSYHPPPVERAEGPPVHVPPSVAPRGPDQLPIVPVEIGSEKTTLVLIKNADVVRMVNDSIDTASLMAVPRENEDDDQAAIGAAGRPVLGGPGTAEMGQAMMRSLRVELAMPTVAQDYIGPVAGAEVAAEWYEPAYVALVEYGVSPGVRVETDAVQVTITSRNDGAVMGIFSADFSQGSQNVDAIFRGRIEGRFCMGVIHDEPAGDRQAPEDPSAMLPTDFFIGLARAGMNTREIVDALREAVADMQDTGGGDEPPSSSSGGSPGGTTGVSGACTITRGEFDTWFQDTYGQVSGLSSAQRNEIRGQLLENWTFTEQMICNILGRS